MSRVFDTSVLYAAFHREDVNHARARTDLAAFAPWRVPLAVLTEFLNLVAFRFGAKAARSALGDLKGAGLLEIVQPQEPAAVDRIWDSDTRLSYADAVGIQEALQSGVPLLTYDHVQDKAYRALTR